MTKENTLVLFEPGILLFFCFPLPVLPFETSASPNIPPLAGCTNNPFSLYQGLLRQTSPLEMRPSRGSLLQPGVLGKDWKEGKGFPLKKKRRKHTQRKRERGKKRDGAARFGSSLIVIVLLRCLHKYIFSFLQGMSLRVSSPPFYL